MRNALRRASSISADHLDLAASRLDLLPGRLREAVRAHLQRDMQLAVPQNLNAVPLLLDQTGLPEKLRRHARPRRKAVQILELDFLILLPERVLEPALGNPAHQGHLTAFE